jgi:hypothetical protein
MVTPSGFTNDGLVPVKLYKVTGMARIGRKEMGTYKNIQAYVKTNYGRSVKTCWIAHVKEICGLKPNLAVNRLDAATRKHPCPENRQGYIREAFIHFCMIKL